MSHFDRAICRDFGPISPLPPSALPIGIKVSEPNQIASLNADRADSCLGQICQTRRKRPILLDNTEQISAPSSPCSGSGVLLKVPRVLGAFEVSRCKCTFSARITPSHFRHGGQGHARWWSMRRTSLRPRSHWYGRHRRGSLISKVLLLQRETVRANTLPATQMLPHKPRWHKGHDFDGKMHGTEPFRDH